jgi:hypothetical protein
VSASRVGPSAAAVTASTARLLRRPLPFGAGGARHKVAARNVALADWLEVTGDDVAGQLAEKRRLFETRRGEVLASLPGSEEAADELLDLVRGTMHDDAAALPRVPVPAGLHPLEEAGRLVPEDLCLHLPHPSTGELVLCAGAVCFPNRWRLAEKLGRAVAAVHAPVPGYLTQLSGPVERLMDRLPADRVLERSNWGLADGADLFAPGDRSAGPLPPGAAGERLWLRIERQTLRRLPRSGAVVFTIRTFQAPIGILRTDPEAACLLARAIRELPPDVADYKLGSAAVKDAVLGWLVERC